MTPRGRAGVTRGPHGGSSGTAPGTTPPVPTTTRRPSGPSPECWEATHGTTSCRTGPGSGRLGDVCGPGRLRRRDTGLDTLLGRTAPVRREGGHRGLAGAGRAPGPGHPHAPGTHRTRSPLAHERLRTPGVRHAPGGRVRGRRIPCQGPSRRCRCRSAGDRRRPGADRLHGEDGSS